jgi:hypothetical protein
MRACRPGTLPGCLILAALASALILGQPGCTGFQLGGLPGGSASTLGFLINTDTASDILGAVRLADGSAVYAYGTFLPDGNIGELQAAVLVSAAGQEAAITFENGLARKARGFDGSTLNITYDEISPQRLRGRVDLFFAAAAPGEQNQSIAFDVDLLQAAADLAQQVQQLTGLTISAQPPPQDPNGRAIVPAPAGPKTAGQSQLILVFAPFYQHAIATAGYIVVQVMARLVDVLVRTVATVVVSLTRVVIVAVCSPFILLGDIMRAAATQPILAVNLAVRLALAGVTIPRRPLL